jgi:uncharacterized membrane protein YuzA (DUF378 family)
MKNSPVFWVLVGVGGVWVYHYFVKPMPYNKKGE